MNRLNIKDYPPLGMNKYIARVKNITFVWRILHTLNKLAYILFYFLQTLNENKPKYFWWNNNWIHVCSDCLLYCIEIVFYFEQSFCSKICMLIKGLWIQCKIVCLFYSKSDLQRSEVALVERSDLTVTSSVVCCLMVAVLLSTKVRVDKYRACTCAYYDLECVEKNYLSRFSLCN